MLIRAIGQATSITIIALTDIILQEGSTPEVDDVVRLEDDTERPDGKIDSEHTV